MWMGETPKNIAAVFRRAREEHAVLFFDEADAIACRRSTSVDHGFQRESNTVVSVLLQELESFNGVVIFATNLAANFDPAFERRIRSHVLFEMPGVDEREHIWRVQMHPTLTPLADDVDFRSLAETYDGQRRRHSQCGSEGRARRGRRTGPRCVEGDPPAPSRCRHPRRHHRQAASCGSPCSRSPRVGWPCSNRTRCKSPGTVASRHGDGVGRGWRRGPAGDRRGAPGASAVNLSGPAKGPRYRRAVRIAVERLERAGSVSSVEACAQRTRWIS